MNQSEKNYTEISTTRKLIYYSGLTITVIGMVLFVSVFFRHDMRYGREGWVMILIGVILMAIGSRGLAGSGLLLNPKKARQDLKPHTTAIGGMVSDVFDGMEENAPLKSKEVIKIRCQHCQTLNDEDSKFCKNCGREI